MDRRQTKTRNAVFKAFVELLEEKGYPAITVQDIIDRADIGRSTFYSHFNTKEDLLNVLCEGIFEHAFSASQEKEATHDFTGRGDLKGELTHILYHLGDSRSYVRGILSSESGHVFMRYFKDHLREVFGREENPAPEGIPRDYAVEHSVCWFAETVRWWMKNDSYAPEQVMELFWRYMRYDRRRRPASSRNPAAKSGRCSGPLSASTLPMRSLIPLLTPHLFQKSAEDGQGLCPALFSPISREASLWLRSAAC